MFCSSQAWLFILDGEVLSITVVCLHSEIALTSFLSMFGGFLAVTVMSKVCFLICCVIFVGLLCCLGLCLVPAPVFLHSVVSLAPKHVFWFEPCLSQNTLHYGGWPHQPCKEFTICTEMFTYIFFVFPPNII